MQVLFVNISGFFQSDPLFSGRCWRKTMCFRMTKIPVLLIDFPFVSDKEPPSQSKFSNPHVCWLYPPSKSVAGWKPLLLYLGAQKLAAAIQLPQIAFPILAAKRCWSLSPTNDTDIYRRIFHLCGNLTNKSPPISSAAPWWCSCCLLWNLRSAHLWQWHRWPHWWHRHGQSPCSRSWHLPGRAPLARWVYHYSIVDSGYLWWMWF